MKEEVRNLTIEEFWEKYSKDYENGIDRDLLMCSDYQHFELCKNEYFDKDGDYVDYDYSVCARNEGSPVEYHPNTKMSDVFGAIYDELKERHLEMFNDMKSWIEDEEFDGKSMLSREFHTLKIDFIKRNADKLGIEYYYDDCYNMHITKIEKVWV